MVMSLHKIAKLEDHKLLSGYIAMFLGEFDTAQAAFMESSLPAAALKVTNRNILITGKRHNKHYCSY